MSKACNRNIQSSTVDPAHAQVKPKLFKGKSVTLLQVSPTYVMEQLPACGCNVTKESSSEHLHKVWLLNHETWGGVGGASVHMKPTIPRLCSHTSLLKVTITSSHPSLWKPRCIGGYDTADTCTNCIWVSSHTG